MVVAMIAREEFDNVPTVVSRGNGSGRCKGLFQGHRLKPCPFREQPNFDDNVAGTVV